MLPIDDNDSTSDGVSDALLTKRLRAVIVASTEENIGVNFDWLVMHIWLTKTDNLQAAYAKANRCMQAGGNGKMTFDTCIDRMDASLKRVLPAVLPLMAEFSSATEIRQWLISGGAERALSNPAFLQRGCEAGIPLVMADIVYAMGPKGPFGAVTFMDTASRARRAIAA